MNNPRWKSGKRRRYQKRFRAMNSPCGICNGRLGPIRYDQPSDNKHPLSFVIDEIIPVSRWREYGYNSPSDVADDYSNLQAAHRICNQMKGNKVGYTLPNNTNNNKKINYHRRIESDGEW